jgi:hypothetical protein
MKLSPAPVNSTSNIISYITVGLSLLPGKFAHISPSTTDRGYIGPTSLGWCVWATAYSAVSRYRDLVKETIIFIIIGLVPVDSTHK